MARALKLDPRAAALAAELSAELARPVRVSFGRARRNVIVAKRHGEQLELRLAEPFAEAPADVRAALAAWLRSGKRARHACARLDAYVAELAERLGPPPPRRVRIRARGAVHDLAELARELLALELSTELPPETAERVTWGRRATRPARRTMQLGSYDPARRVVRVHPILDQEAVPRFFVRYVLFHELLHAALDGRAGEAEGTRKRQRGERHHGPEFVRREREYADYERALAWQTRQMGALFRSARSGKPMRAAR